MGFMDIYKNISPALSFTACLLAKTTNEDDRLSVNLHLFHFVCLAGKQSVSPLCFSMDSRGTDNIQGGGDKMRAGYRQPIICFPGSWQICHSEKSVYCYCQKLTEIWYLIWLSCLFKSFPDLSSLFYTADVTRIWKPDGKTGLCLLLLAHREISARCLLGLPLNVNH